MSVAHLKTEIRIQNIKLRQKEAEIKKLKEALRAFIAQNEGGRISEEYASQTSSDLDAEMLFPKDDDEEDEDEGSEAEEVEEDIALPEPIFNEREELYFCTKCASEVLDGVCFMCGEKHLWLVDEAAQESISTDTQAIHPDRSLVPRGNTPLREIDVPDEQPPAQYCASHYPVRREPREEEYLDLLRRGATRQMCEAFYLEFSYEGGIYAWADTDIFDEFSGSLMGPGDFWKIHLGRRISLDADDKDGSVFMEGLLEDILLYQYRGPFTRKKYERWETAEESSGIWVTRLQQPSKEDDDAASQSSWSSRDSAEGDAECAQEDKDMETSTPEDTVIRPDQYSFSDDDLDQADLEMDDLGYYNPGLRDAVWEGDSEVDQLDNDVNVKTEDHDMHLEHWESGDDSDEAGSDFDSDELLSGDEMIGLRRC